MPSISPELNLVVGEALARWASETRFEGALPPVWLKSLHEMVQEYHRRLVDSGKFEPDGFAEDVFKLVSCFGVGFIPRAPK